MYMCLCFCVCVYVCCVHEIVSFKKAQNPVATATSASTRTSLLTHLLDHQVQLMFGFRLPCSMIVVFESRRVVVKVDCDR